ncbi:hypothetical protein VP01_7052g1 [Puccinia sorghi]|uniref:Tc1-like transposase DDE domain-containing protein n=1 Tax=Puccinia sorghi TaxID=27349 RepID=A0A0L6UDT2_9BASI|nr:hypothetical protein VP01_7052g1 [Puccinia sorghi]
MSERTGRLSLPFHTSGMRLLSFKSNTTISGFNSDAHLSHGYSISGKLIYFIFQYDLENKCKRKPNQAFGAMLEGGTIYFELLCKDGKKKTGMTSIDICNFLVHLQDQCPAKSIIIMDNTRIHGVDDFQRVKYYSLFLNPIELTFNIIKTENKHKEMKS